MRKAKKIESEKITLSSVIRKTFGKQLKKLRKEGIIPANVFGPNFKSISISVQYKDFIKTYRVARETGIIYLQVDKEEIPVLVKDIQKHPVLNQILHVDFRKVDLKQKVQTEVPVQIVGISEAVTQKGGVLLTQQNKLLVEALPQDIPSHIEVRIQDLKEIGQEIKVASLQKNPVYEIKNNAEQVIVSVIAHKEESITPETTSTTPEVLTEAKPEEGAEETGEATKTAPAPTTPTTPTAEKKETKKPAPETKK